MSPPPVITAARRRVLLRRYGLTEEDYVELWRLQGGACGACRRRFTATRIAHVDHNHRTGDCRGLLCGRCNHLVLGHLGEDAAFYRQLADYLDGPPATRLGGAPRRSPDAPPVNDLEG
jgi:hypothetical protein